MVFYLRFYAYDDALCRTYQYLKADLKTSSLAGFTRGQMVILIEQTEDSIAQDYVVIANHRQKRTYHQLSNQTDAIQARDIYVMREKDWQEASALLTQVINPWYGSTL